MLDGEHVSADVDGAGHVTARYLYGEQVDAFRRWRDTDGLAWYLPDQLGSVRDIADAAAPVDQIDYDAFGNIISESIPRPATGSSTRAGSGRRRLVCTPTALGTMILPEAASSTAILSGLTAATETCTGMWKTIR